MPSWCGQRQLYKLRSDSVSFVAFTLQKPTEICLKINRYLLLYLEREVAGEAIRVVYVNADVNGCGEFAALQKCYALRDRAWSGRMQKTQHLQLSVFLSVNKCWPHSLLRQKEVLSRHSMSL